MMLSLNNKVVLEAYQQGQGLKADIKSGFAMVAQKKNIIPLKVLIGVVLSDGTRIEAGTKAYLSEEELSTQPWAKQVKQIPDILGDTPCILVDSKNIIFFSEEEK
jgi:hypothetical protein